MIIDESFFGSHLIVLYAAIEVTQRDLPGVFLLLRQCSLQTGTYGALDPTLLLRLLLWFRNAMIIAFHVGHFTGERTTGSLVLVQFTT